MPRIPTLGLAALGVLALVACSREARSPEPAPSATLQSVAPQPVTSDPVVHPISAPEVAALTPTTPAPRTTGPEQAASAARQTRTEEPAPTAAGTATPRTAPVPARTLPHDRDVPVEYVALGDSTVAGVGATGPDASYVGRIFARLKDAYPAAKVDNLGVAGATSADVARQQLVRAVALRPTLVTLSVGPNDITQGRSVEEYERHVDTILGTLARETDAVVVVNTLPDMALSPIFRPEEQPIVGALARAFNEVLVRKARQYGAEVIELYAPSQDEVPANTSLFAADNYHPSDAGYARWAELMWRGVEARLEGRG